MATNTKSRATPSKQPTVLRTPEPKSRMRQGAPGSVMRGEEKFTAQQKEAILLNLELEVTERTQRFQEALASTLKSFMNRKKFETIRIPEALRGMTLRELQKHWDGNLSLTVEKMQRDILEREKAEQRDKEERERAAQEGAKRKRAEEETDGHKARGKTPRKGKTPALTPLGKSASSRAGIRSKQPLFSNPNNKPSDNAEQKGLPQDHVFAPHFAAGTPVRQLKKTDILYTANGSPILNPYTASQTSLSVSPIARKGAAAGGRSPLRQVHARLPSGSEDEGNDTLRADDGHGGGQDDVGGANTTYEARDGDNDGDGDLPDVEELERQLEAQALGDVYRPAGRMYPSLGGHRPGSGMAASTLGPALASHLGLGSGSGSSSSASSRVKRQSTSHGGITSTISTAGRTKRPSSLLIRRSILPTSASTSGSVEATTLVQPGRPTFDSATDPQPHPDLPSHLRRIIVGTHEIVFDPLNLDRKHLQKELDEAEEGYTEEEKRRVGVEVGRIVNAALEELSSMWAT